MGVDFTDNSQIFKDAMSDAVERAVEAIGLTAEGFAKLKCPVDTGRLRNSITHTANGNTAYIGTNVFYAPYVEFGTIKMTEQPFLKPAATEHGDLYKQIALNELRK